MVSLEVVVVVEKEDKREEMVDLVIAWNIICSIYIQNLIKFL